MAYTFKTPFCQAQTTEGKLLDSGYHTLTNSQVNPLWFASENLEWNGQDLKLPNDPHGTLLTLRGGDVPEFPNLARKSKRRKTAWVRSMARGMLQFVGGGRDMSFGGPEVPREEGQIKFSVDLSTQLPSLSLSYKLQGPDGNRTCYRIILHGNTGMEDVTYYSPESVRSGAANIYIPPSFKQIAAEGRLFALAVHFGKTEYYERYCNCVTILHNSHEEHEQDRWNSNADMIETMRGQTERKFFDIAIREMFFGKNMRMIVLRELHRTDQNLLPRFDHEYKLWETIMKLSIKYGGPFWFYRMQPSFNESAPGAYSMAWSTAENPPPVPFWLVKKFKAIVVNRHLTKLVPVEIAPLLTELTVNDGHEWILPHPDCSTLLRQLHLTRDALSLYPISNLVLESDRIPPTAVKPKRQIESKDNVRFFRMEFSVEASTSGSPAAEDGANIWPDIGTAVSVTLNFEGNNKTVSAHGRIVNEPRQGEDGALVIYGKLSS